MYESSSRGSRSAGSAVRARPPESPLDDWLGEISDDDWSEEGTARAQHGRITHSSEELPAGDMRSRTAARPSYDEEAAAADARAVVYRRRLVAVLVAALVLGLAVALPLLLLRGGSEAPAPTASVPTAAGPETEPSSPSTTPPATTPSTGTGTTTPSTGGTSSFSLPEGTKLEVGGENDAALVRELQRALTQAGYDPGAADGTFGPQTEAAVVAFQQDNGLSVDGRVGPETASALNSALAAG